MSVKLKKIISTIVALSFTVGIVIANIGAQIEWNLFDIGMALMIDTFSVTVIWGMWWVNTINEK